jgi:selenocysteine-specific elongation factor
VKVGDFLGAALAASSDTILTHAELERLTQCTPEGARTAITVEERRHAVVPLGESWLVTARLGELAGRVKLALERHHRNNPYAWGMPPQQLCKLFGIGPRDVARLAEELTRSDSDIVLSHGSVALAGHRPALSEEQIRAQGEISRRVEAAGISPPARGDLQGALALSTPEMSLLVRLLKEDGRVTILRKHLLSTAVFERCRQQVVELLSVQPVIDVNAFREATGMSRRVAVEVLELFDAQGLTRRVEDGRVLANPSARVTTGR